MSTSEVLDATGVDELGALARMSQRVTSGEARRIREAAHVSAAELGRAAGLAARTVQRYEAGQRPRGAVALRYARALDLLAQVTQ